MSTPTGANSYSYGGGGAANLQFIQPYVAPAAGNQVYSEQQTAAAAAMRQQQQSVQLSDFTYIKETDGEGVGAFTVMFDCVFTSEPVLTYGAAIVDFTDRNAGEIASSQATVASEQQALASNPKGTEAYYAKLAQVNAAQAKLAEVLKLGFDPADIPLSNVYVKRWLTDNQSNYIGAECIVVVRKIPIITEVPVISESSSEGPLS